MKAGWKFWEKNEDKEDEEDEEEPEMVNVSRIIGLRYGKEQQDNYTGIEYKLRWEDGFEDSWCVILSSNNWERVQSSYDLERWQGKT